MLRSMTGFGRFQHDGEFCSQQWEIKSVNGRHLEIKWKLPRIARHLEQSLDRMAKKSALRGRIEISLVLRFANDAFPNPGFDSGLAGSMLRAVEEFARARGDAFKPDYSRLLGIPSLWQEPETDEIAGLASELEDGLGNALADWNASRSIEGQALGRDMLGRVSLLAAWTDQIRQFAPEIREQKFEALKGRLKEALAGQEIDGERLLQESVVLADRLDATEELTRLDAHLERLQSLLREGNDAGRRLDFTLQECFREINTCCNKLLDPRVSRIAADYKNELEKCREQAMNLE